MLRSSVHFQSWLLVCISSDFDPKWEEASSQPLPEWRRVATADGPTWKTTMRPNAPQGEVGSYRADASSEAGNAMRIRNLNLDRSPGTIELQDMKVAHAHAAARAAEALSPQVDRVGVQRYCREEGRKEKTDRPMHTATRQQAAHERLVLSSACASLQDTCRHAAV